MKVLFQLCFALLAHATFAQTLSLPSRVANAPAGSEFVKLVAPLDFTNREQAVFMQVCAGNIPDFLRKLVPVTVTNVVGDKTNIATFYVTPDYMAVGPDGDYFFAPMSPAGAQRIADRLGCVLPTPKMVDAIFAAADVKLAPLPIPPSDAMTSVAVLAEHNDAVRVQRAAQLAAHPPGALVAGDKKDVVVCARLAASPGKVAIYGWHQTNGSPIQPLYVGHAATWVDYSHGIRLVQQKMILNGEPTTVADVLTNPKVASLLSDEGVVVNPRYPTNDAPVTNCVVPALADFKSTGQFGELAASFTFTPEVKITVNAPSLSTFDTNKPLVIVYYALPNGNTTEQTIGRKLRPDDDWHFNIQHIGAQTWFLREILTKRTIVVAYLEADMKSWPAWRKKYGDELIPQIIGSVRNIFAEYQSDLVLTGHSGGGSFTFGYLNTVKEIPDYITRIAFLDSDYAYDAARGHDTKLSAWLKASDKHALRVIAYNDAVALYNGKPFVSAEGGTWGRSHAMLNDLGSQFQFTSHTNGDLADYSALDGRVRFLLLENPERKILHTVQVERNGFIHAMVSGTSNEGRGYKYMGERAYAKWIEGE